MENAVRAGAGLGRVPTILYLCRDLVSVGRSVLSELRADITMVNQRVDRAEAFTRELHMLVSQQGGQLSDFDERMEGVEGRLFRCCEKSY